MITAKTHKKKFLNIYIVITLIFIILFVINIINHKKNKQKINIINDVKSHYSNNVITNTESKLYNSKGKVVGKISKNINLKLAKQTIDENTNKFKLEKIESLEDIYILYNNVEKFKEKPKEQINRYKKYIPFNENIITKDKTSFYSEDDQLLYTLNSSFTFNILIKDDNRFGIEFNNQLLYIHKEDIERIEEHDNTSLHNSSGVAVLNYHFFYDESDEEEAAGCKEDICASKKQFKTHLDYIKEHDIFTLTMHELELYLDGKIRLPKSVLITIDDGGRTESGLELLDEYKMNATVFLVTSWFNPDEYYSSEYIEFHSHSHDLHEAGLCPGRLGSGFTCLPRETLLSDLKKSREALHGSTAFCYPFYEHNAYSEEIIKEAGFTMAFIGEKYTSYGYQLATVGMDKFKIPRFVVVDYTTMKEFDKYFNEIK